MRRARAIGDQDFGDVVLGSGVPVLVAFHAAGAGACRGVVALLDDLADELPALAFARLDVTRHPVTVAAYDVTGLPTFLVFDRGQPVLTVVGARPMRVLRDLLLGVTGVQPA